MRQFLRNSILIAACTLSGSLYADVNSSIAPDLKENTMTMQQQQYQWTTVPTQSISSNGITFAYRELGQQNGGTPIIFLNHLAAVLDNWDPRIIDGIAAKHHVVVFDNRGVGASTGQTADSIEQMADDAISFIRAKGFEQVDLFGFSMGGMISQEIVLKEPKLVRKLILAGTGPAGGKGISTVGKISDWDLIRGLVTRQDPKVYLFFTRTDNGKTAAKDFIQRINERTTDRDQKITLSAYRTQLKALKKWGKKTPVNLSVIQQPALVANGEHDRMVPTINTYDLAKRLPNSHLIIYPDAGHGGIFQFHQDFVAQSLKFLAQ